MIVTAPKPLEAILDAIDSVQARSLFLVGCGTCAAAVGTGGQAALDRAASEFERLGYRVLGCTVPESGCSIPGTRAALRPHAMVVARADAVVVYACGTGVQTVAEVVAQPALPALDSQFLGNSSRIGMYAERCRTCGDCVLDRTAGICPLTQCPKGLLNGPCGGMDGGMCEVVPGLECAHVAIGRRLVAQGRPKRAPLGTKNYDRDMHPGVANFRAPRNYSSAPSAPNKPAEPTN